MTKAKDETANDCLTMRRKKMRKTKPIIKFRETICVAVKVEVK